MSLYGLVRWIPFHYSPEEFSREISKNDRASSFFSEVILLDDKGNVLANYPMDSPWNLPWQKRKLAISSVVLEGQKPQVSIAPRKDGDSDVTFLRPIAGEDGTAIGVLLGRTQFALNQDLEQLFAALNTFERSTGNAILFNGGMLSVDEVRPEFAIIQLY